MGYSGQITAPVKSLLNPVCSVLQSNKSMISMVFALIVTFSYLPIDDLLKTNVQSTLLNNLRINGGLVMKIVMSVLVLCFYFNGDVMNLVLLLWLVKALRL